MQQPMTETRIQAAAALPWARPQHRRWQCAAWRRCPGNACLVQSIRERVIPYRFWQSPPRRPVLKRPTLGHPERARSARDWGPAGTRRAVPRQD